MVYLEKAVTVSIPEPKEGVPLAGMILLSTDFTSERDFRYLASLDSLEFDLYVNRIHFENPMTVDSLSGVLNELSLAAADILPGQDLDAVLFNCTSASALLGFNAINEVISAVKPGSGVLTTAKASVDEMLQSGHRKISVLAPYEAGVSRGLADYFERHGLAVNSLSYMGIADDRIVPRLDARTIIEASCTATDEDSDALFISCTATRAVEILPRIEEAIGVPVFSSNYCSFRQLQRTLRSTAMDS